MFLPSIIGLFANLIKVDIKLFHDISKIENIQMETKIYSI